MGRRKKDALPSYRRHKPSGQAVVTLDGKDIYLGPWRSKDSKVAYERAIAEWLACGHAAPLTGATDATVDAVLVAFWRHAQQHYRKDERPTSEVRLVQDALAPVHRLYGTTPARSFGPVALKATRQSMIGAGWSRGVVNHAIGRVRRAFRWGVENELVPAGVYHGLQAVSGLQRGRSEARETEPVLPVSEDHVRAVLPHLQPRVAAMVELQLVTGMRPHEVTILRARDLTTSVTPWVYTPASHKTQHHGHERRVFIGPRGQVILKPWLKPDLSGYVFSPRDGEAERHAERKEQRVSPMTPSQSRRRPKARPDVAPGECYTVASYRHAIARACDDAGVPQFAPNRLRHAAATRIRSKYGLEAAQVLLGHASAVVTQVYAERDFAEAARVAMVAG